MVHSIMIFEHLKMKINYSDALFLEKYNRNLMYNLLISIKSIYNDERYHLQVFSEKCVSKDVERIFD